MHLNEFNLVLIFFIILAQIQYSEGEVNEIAAVEAVAEVEAMASEEKFLQTILFHPSLNITGPGPDQYKIYMANNGTIEGGHFVSKAATPNLLISNAVFDVPTDDTIFVEAVLSFRSRLTEGSLTNAPLGIDEDFFYGHGTMGFIDSGSGGWAFQFYITNLKVYAVYGRFPMQFDRKYAFMYAVPVFALSCGCPTTNTYAVAISRRLRKVWYYVNGRLVLEVARLGELLSAKFQFGERAGKAIDGIIGGPYGGSPCGCGEYSPDLPRTLRVIIGNGGLIAKNAGRPHGACQRTLLAGTDATTSGTCRQIKCQYAPTCPAQPRSTFTIELDSQFFLLNVVRLTGCVGRESPLECVARCPGMICGYPAFYDYYSRRRVMNEGPGNYCCPPPPCQRRCRSSSSSSSSYSSSSSSYSCSRRRRSSSCSSSRRSSSSSSSGSSSCCRYRRPKPIRCAGAANAPWWIKK